jgi:hypothetical protein
MHLQSLEYLYIAHLCHIIIIRIRTLFQLAPMHFGPLNLILHTRAFSSLSSFILFVLLDHAGKKISVEEVVASLFSNANNATYSKKGVTVSVFGRCKWIHLCWPSLDSIRLQAHQKNYKFTATRMSRSGII